MAYTPAAVRVAHVMDDPQNWENFLGLIRTGKPFGLACKAVRVSRQAMNTYLDSRPERSSQYIDAELEATEAVEQVLYEEALGRQKWAVQLWLERRDADRWGPKTQDGPKRLVLDPEDLKGMIGSGTESAAVVDDDGGAVAEPAPEVGLLDVGDVDAGGGLDLPADAADLPGGR